ncbi:Post-GPI attachment to proteins factor 2 [Hypsibius exemplaris]|uniref:Post-GPI attachment to proteins factor 2 n=1 Tax=Hypsibius exemplaris TaxID=2072580 RepID=A0A1W0WZ68_HYPEX|nr:Post-GPI attachment to proteins factor 2 [Hypsibius exemplaris]
MAFGRSYGTLMTIKFEFLFVTTLSLPLVSLIICVFLALFFEFDRAVATHCMVRNYLPSLSASIGGFTPQRYIWRTGVAFHSAPRLFVSLMYYNFYNSFASIRNNEFLRKAATVNCIVNMLEILALLLLTYVSSTENYGVHEKMFISFMVFSIAHMLITLYLFRHLRDSDPEDVDLRRSLTWKHRLAVFNWTIFVMSLYFFFRHNKHCEPGVYTLFALCEYLVVLSNIFFHGTAYFDFKDYVFLAKNTRDEFPSFKRPA